MGNSINVLQHDESGTIINDAIASHPTLRQYKVEVPLVPGSGRMTRTFRLRHGSRVEASAVLKAAAFVEDEPTTASVLHEQQRELERIKRAVASSSSSSSSPSACSSLPHVAPFLTWFVDPPKVVRGVKVRTVFLLRPHLYTTLSDRLASRPWLTSVEKMWITHQLLQSLSDLHDAGVCHGFLTTENVGLTSLNYVTLMDLSSYKAVRLRDDDPSQYLQHFQLQHGPSQLHVKRSEKRCYLAPERFSGAAPGFADGDEAARLTPAMDVFSAGCVIAELFLNGERLMDLGDLIEYRKLKELPPPIQQKLAKIESSHLRAACRHMLQLEPAERMTAREYWQRLDAGGQFPSSFPVLTEVLERMNAEVSPDARVAIAASRYETVLWETTGEKDLEGALFLSKALGLAAASVLSPASTTAAAANETMSDTPMEIVAAAKDRTAQRASPRDLLAETEDLLRQLDDLDASLWTNSTLKAEAVDPTPGSEHSPGPETKAERSESCRNSLLIFLQLILATVQKVQRPTTKVVALKLIERLAKYAGDEARLQRIVPVAVSLLHDQDALIRAAVLKTLTYTVSIIQTFSPSDSKVFPQYILKSVTPLVTDPSLVVRVVLAECVAALAETALRFLDISHAVRLYEAVGGGTGSVTPDSRARNVEVAENVFTDELTRLLDANSTGADWAQPSHAKVDSSVSRKEGSRPDASRTLISSTYAAEFSGLVDTISRWVVSIATDQSEHSAVPKRALLHDLDRLCSFFGLEGVMAFILPQILAFLNERRNWELREALFDAMPSVCHIIGRSATEEFVLPCIEIGLVDSDEAVICSALACLFRLIEMNLISGYQLVGTSDTGKSGLLAKYSALLVHPSSEIRHKAIDVFTASARTIGSPSTEVFVFPRILPLLRYQPSMSNIALSTGLRRCLRAPIERSHFEAEMQSIAKNWTLADSIDGPWTSVDFRFREDAEQGVARKPPTPSAVSDEDSVSDATLLHCGPYLRMLARHTPQSLNQSSGTTKSIDLSVGIEGSIKASQSVLIPRQDTGVAESVPVSYGLLRDESDSQSPRVSEGASIRSLSMLGRVYGLSIMNAFERSSWDDEGFSAGDVNLPSIERNVNELAVAEAAYRGQWGSEALVEPDAVDTTLLVAKLQGLHVPPLPPDLGHARRQLPPSASAKAPASRDSFPIDWRPKTNALLARSAAISGHTAPVVRLAVSADGTFVASGSNDGTCRVWDLSSIEESAGILESSLVYAGHSDHSTCRVNDVAVVEGGRAFVSGSSNGSVHVWRVDTVPTMPRTSAGDQPRSMDRSNVVGSSSVRVVDPSEGEVATVSHFNSLTSSVLTYATQKGVIHSWDLRCEKEPFRLRHGPELGHITSTTLGGDRHWIVSGTSRGYVTVWDVRFQQPVTLWQHPSGSPIARLASSVVAPPQTWGSKTKDSRSRPFMFVACGRDECAMFDAMTGKCFESFKTVRAFNGDVNSSTETVADLTPLPVSLNGRRNFCTVGTRHMSAISQYMPTETRVTCFVGSIGQSQSFLITGDNDANVKFWDFSSTSKCYTVCGPSSIRRSSYERIDFDAYRRLMLCRLPNYPATRQPTGSSKAGIHHSEGITDLKIIDNRWLITCSRDCTVRVWR